MPLLTNLYFRACSPSVLLRWPLWPWGSMCILCGVRWLAGSWLCPPWFWFPATPSTCSVVPTAALNRCRSLKSSLSWTWPAPSFNTFNNNHIMVALTLIHMNSVSSSVGGRWPPPRRSQSHQAMKNSRARPAWVKFPCSPDRSGWNNPSFSFSRPDPWRLSSIYFPVNIRELKRALKPSVISCWIKGPVCRFNLFSQIKYTFFIA